ncbi:MAG TPA: sn-glycerol-3-phosphate ABC transporter ATP-binding protein UgpC [Gemmatimonadaceae bacterium]
MASVRLQGVRKVYEQGGRQQVAVHGVDLEIADGELVVLVGPSGCGKSTTLRMIAGLESISDGTVTIGDRVVNDLPPRDRDIAMVFQNYALYPHMTAYENMAFALRLRKRPEREIDERVRRAAETLGIEELLLRTPRAMSGGQRQRVAVGRALVREPQVFLFDEPLSNLDAKLRVQMRREFARLHKRLGATMVYVTHDQVEAMTLGDRIVVMNDGKVQQIDSPMALYERPRNTFVARFIGTPPMNLIDGTVVNDGGIRFRSADGTLTLSPTPAWTSRLAPLASSGRGVILGIRPEDIAVRDASSGASGTEASVPARIDLVEPTGNEALLYVTSASHDLAIRTDRHTLPAVGAEVTLLLTPARTHFFDSASGVEVGRGEGEERAESRQQ